MTPHIRRRRLIQERSALCEPGWLNRRPHLCREDCALKDEWQRKTDLMTTPYLRHFAKPEVLRSLADQSFLALLKPHAEFFASQGILLCEGEEAFQPDYQRLASLFLSPDSGVPAELAEALFFIDSLATPDGMDLLLEAIPQVSPPFYHWTPHDVAVQSWLADRPTFERVFAERQVRKRSRSFITFRANQKRSDPDKNLAAIAPDLERELDRHFQDRGRGRGTQVLTAQKGQATWFLIRHGEPLRREGCLQDGESSSIFFRPEKFDAVVYDAQRSELQINATSRWQKELYRRLFGNFLFDSENGFASDDKYTLQPLITDGAAALNCLDVAGIQAVRLVALAWQRPGQYGVETTKKAPDLFAALEQGEWDFPEDVGLTSAQFEIHFVGSRSPRLVTVTPPNLVKYTLDSDGAAIEEWLWKRGFVITSWREHDTDPILACA